MEILKWISSNGDIAAGMGFMILLALAIICITVYCVAHNITYAIWKNRQ